MNRQLILKSPRFVPFGANLAKFKAKSDIPVLGEPKCTETDLKKSQICPFLGQSDLIWFPNLTALIHSGNRCTFLEKFNTTTDSTLAYSIQLSDFGQY